MIINSNDLSNIIKDSCDKDYSILIYETLAEDHSRCVNLGNAIINEGLQINLSNSSLIEMAKPLGYTDDYNIFDVVNHKWGNGSMSMNIIISIPQVFKYIDGTEMFVGGYDKSEKRAFPDNKYLEKYKNLAIDSYIRRREKVPSEFILGYIVFSQEGGVEYISNPNFIGLSNEPSKFDKHKMERSIDVNSSTDSINESIEYYNKIKIEPIMQTQLINYKEKYALHVKQ